MIYDPQLTALNARGHRYNLAVESAQAHPEVPMLLAWAPNEVPDVGTLRAIRTRGAARACRRHYAGLTFEANRSPDHRITTSRGHAMKLLLVDDDPHLLDALHVGAQLQWEDAQILTAADGETGLEVFFSEEPDVVLLDVTMPQMNGFEVLKAIRQVSDVPVIMLTARGDDVDQVRGLELGADHYVPKPFSHLALMARIKAALRRAELPRPVQALPDFQAGDLGDPFPESGSDRRWRAGEVDADRVHTALAPRP